MASPLTRTAHVTLDQGWVVKACRDVASARALWSVQMRNDPGLATSCSSGTRLPMPVLRNPGARPHPGTCQFWDGMRVY